MELDTLRDVFLNRMTEPVMNTGTAELERMIKLRSYSPVAMLKRNLRLELYLAFLFLLFPIFIVAKNEGLYVSVFAIVAFAAALDFIFRVKRSLKAINRFESVGRAVKQHLQLLTGIMKNFCRLYLLSTMVLIPLFFTSAFIVIQVDNSARDPLFFKMITGKILMIYVAAFFSWSVMMYYFTKWWLNKLYGKHLIFLGELLKEIDNQ